LKKPVTILISLLIIVGALLACGSSSDTNTNASSTSNTTSSTQATKAPSKPLTWKTTHHFEGNGSKKTQTFTVGDDWKIVYTCQGMGSGFDANFAVDVESTDGSMSDSGAVNLICKDGKKTTDVTEEHQGGTVYLSILGDSPWTIDIQEQK
jgi:hypothetical protein